MFGSSTQYRSWTFDEEKQLTNLRVTVNRDFIQKFGNKDAIPDPENHFLSAKEEHQFVRIYEHSLRDFCKKFQDPRDPRIRMPVYVTTTAQHYFKRFYLYNSVMDYHPKEILVTCVYLACKIEEFYVTINDFVYNLNGDKKKAAEIILNNELQLTQELNFHLIIHQPFRPVEGLLIDIKTRFTELSDPEKLRPFVEEFLEKVHLTDAILLYSPSQIALAAVTTAVSKLGENLDKYVTDILFKQNSEQLSILIEAVRKIRRLVKNSASPIPDTKRKEIEQKVEKCRNKENDPNSAQYRANFTDWDEDDIPLAQPMDQDIEELDNLGVQEIMSPGI